jgi:hypothetical protein
MSFKVEFSPAAEADLERLFDFALAREMNSETGEFDIPERAIKAIRHGLRLDFCVPLSYLWPINFERKHTKLFHRAFLH